MTGHPHEDGLACSGPCGRASAQGAAAASFSVADLVRRGPADLPSELVSSKHLIYSSPAALAFNSPGAEGFGVKRAGLSIPGSVMLIVSPGCCGRNTSLVSRLPGYRDRFFYLTMDQTDVVTSRHLKLIPEAVREVCEGLAQPPSMVMICITCVDALLGTDMERVCTQASKAAGVPVRPCYMYALTREGRRPPMVYVREELYSLLEGRPRRSRVVNVMGFFSPLRDACELHGLLGQAGIRKVNELARCSTYDEYLAMSEANFNLVLDPEARVAAADLERRLGMPSVELRRLYQVERIASQYKALGQVLGCDLDDVPPSFRGGLGARVLLGEARRGPRGHRGVRERRPLRARPRARPRRPPRHGALCHGDRRELCLPASSRRGEPRDPRLLEPRAHDARL
ncbi:MAG: nitrogenase component 1 [Atopobiaceae bacterium]|nr:nitrogenase component 1 [Atopobiaceae bacterium]